MIGFKTGYGKESGTIFKSGNENITGCRKIMGIEFKSGYGYVSGKKNKTG